MTNYAITYTTFLKENQKSPLIIWPEHCLIGHNGVHIQSEIKNALNTWENCTGNAVKYQVKTDHILTESYSAFQSEFPVDEKTSFNWELFDYLVKSDKLIIAGESKCHTINYTIRDLIEKYPKENRNKIVILDSCMSSIKTFEIVAKKIHKGYR